MAIHGIFHATRRLTPPVSAARARGSPRSWGSLRDEPQEASPAVLHCQQPKKKNEKKKTANMGELYGIIVVTIVDLTMKHEE